MDEAFVGPAPALGNVQGTVVFSATGLEGTGFAINPSNGVISGNPAAVGNVEAVVRATSGDRFAETTVAFEVMPSRLQVLVLNGGQLPTAYVNNAYSYDVSENLHLQNVPEGSVQWNISSAGDLPDGIGFDDGILSGIPSIAGYYSFTLGANYDDGADGLEDSDVFMLRVKNRNFRNVSIGLYHACGVTETDGVQCWGNGQHGRLGTGVGTDSLHPEDVIDLQSGVAQVSAGFEHTCVVMKTGGVKCWGRQDNGRLGNGVHSTSGLALPTDIPALGTDNVAVGAGGTHSCALKTNGSVVCWGGNATGQLGDGTTTASMVPVVAIASGAVDITIGTDTNCALMADTSIRCWGRNSRGQIGNNTNVNQLSPVTVIASGVRQVSTRSHNSDYGLTCAAMLDGTAMCWGRDNNGQVGNGSAAGDTWVPMQVQGLTNVISVATGVAHACARLEDGNVWCWGKGSRTGDGTTIDRGAPVQALGLDGVTSIVSGGDISCATMEAVTKCWGTNAHGETGAGNKSVQPTPVSI